MNPYYKDPWSSSSTLPGLHFHGNIRPVQTFCYTEPDTLTHPFCPPLYSLHFSPSQDVQESSGHTLQLGLSLSFVNLPKLVILLY